MVGKYNPQPIRLSSNGIDNLFRNLLDVEMVQSARQAVTGEGICIGLSYKTVNLYTLKPHEANR